MIILFLICLLLFVLYFKSIHFNIAIHNIPKILHYSFPDVFRYLFRYKNIPNKPFINMYIGLFGQGKTLSAVHDCVEFYYTYNDKKVYDDRIGKFVTQKVFILSNVSLVGVPYRKFTSLQQIVNIARWRHITDKKKNQRTITVVIGDEFSVQMNSRNFQGGKTSSGKVIEKNISPLFLNALLTSRHALIHGFFLTSQRFGHVDALLRQVTTNVIECKKVWRLQGLIYYDAWKYENCVNPLELRPERKTGFFVTNEDYSRYDTLAVVADLSKATDDGDMLPLAEQRERIHGEQKIEVNVKKKRRK